MSLARFIYKSFQLIIFIFGAPGRTRTYNPLVRSQVLYPLSYGRAYLKYNKLGKYQN